MKFKCLNCGHKFTKGKYENKICEKCESLNVKRITDPTAVFFECTCIVVIIVILLLIFF